MKKIIALTLIGCMLTSLTACGTVSQQDNRPTTEYSTENEGENPAHDPVDPIDDGYWHDDPTEEPTTEEPTSQPQTGAYTYNVYGQTISMDVNIDDYMYDYDGGQWFDLIPMIYDLGWAGADTYTEADWSNHDTVSMSWFTYRSGDMVTRIDIGMYNEEKVPGTNGYQFYSIDLMYLANEGGMYYADDDSDLMHRNTLCNFGKHYGDCEYRLSGQGWYASYEDIVMITYIFWSASTNPGNNPMIPSFGTNTDFVSSLDNRTIQYSVP